MYQVHSGEQLPRINKGCVWAVDEDGNVEWTTDRAIQIEGSYETKLRLRCDGTKVEVSGNIGRFRRPDNLFGFSYEQCVARWNDVLHDYGLPSFSKGECFYYAGDNHLQWSGAINTRIDLTRNYWLFGRDNLTAFMGWLSSQQHGRLKVGISPDGGTISWGEGSQYVYEKFYDKLREIESRKKTACHYDADVIQLCRDGGVGRHELSLKTRYLTQKGYRFMGEMNMGTLVQLYRERSELVLTDKLSFDDFNDLPRTYRATAKDWRDGVDLATSMPLRTYQRHRRELLKYGIDISTRCKVEHLRPKIKHIEIMPLVAPDWYRKRYG
ncbi:DNA replication protein [Georgfuchsia toluolica]|uniref:DNA replication protein n=2 Tax=Georgfuchsia toluolica TaxID=424218 RepID=A0A916N9D0_9PROT|nr:DNA replication protein [Georgfuchsia toluolica]